MADYSSQIHKWRVTPLHHQQADSKVIKRNRQVISCQPCRMRKLKCDRDHPCEACVKRGDESSCTYSRSSPPQATSRKDDVRNGARAQERLQKLESLVRQMIEVKDAAIADVPSADKPVEASLDRERHATMYTGTSHWSAIMDQIQELRASLPSDSSPDGDEQSPEPAENARPDTIFGAVQPLPLPMLLQAYLPSRQQLDRYLSVYFNASYLTMPFVHSTLFRRQYEKFWQEPTCMPPAWIAILFGILTLADMIKKRSDPKNPGLEGSQYNVEFLSAAAQCLILAEYTKPQPHIIEALSVYTQCRYALVMDPSRECGLVFALMVRLAYNMGYHRDPSKFSGQFTPFESEMRRRMWMTLKQFDVMMSIQVGLPQHIQMDTFDARICSNLQDVDFDEDTKILPPPRPETEPSQMLYFITKSRLMYTYSKVCHHTLSFQAQTPSEEELKRLSDSIDEAEELIPSILQARPMSSSFSDPAYLTMCRTNLMAIPQKARLLLHRKYMTSGTAEARNHRNISVASAKKLIQRVLDIYEEFQPGGQLHEHKWMLTSFTINDFLLSTMVLAFDLWQERKKYTLPIRTSGDWLDQEPDMKQSYDLILRAYDVCTDYMKQSKEAKNAAIAIEMVLNRVRPSNKLTHSTAASASGPVSIEMSGDNFSGNSDKAIADLNDHVDHSNFQTLSLENQISHPTEPNSASIPSSFGDLQPSSSNGLSNASPSMWNMNLKYNTFPASGMTPATAANPTPNFDSVLDLDAQTMDWSAFDQFLVNAEAMPPLMHESWISTPNGSLTTGTSFLESSPSSSRFLPSTMSGGPASASASEAGSGPGTHNSSNPTMTDEQQQLVAQLGLGNNREPGTNIHVGKVDYGLMNYWGGMES